MSNGAIQKSRKFKATTGDYLWQPGLQAGQPDLLLGKPVFENPAMAAVASASKSVAFGDFSAYLVREVVPMNVVLSSEFAFQTDEIAIRTTWRIDGDLPDVNAIAYLVSGNS
jgi:HK97 family phage major capsid protein